MQKRLDIRARHRQIDQDGDRLILRESSDPYTTSPDLKTKALSLVNTFPWRLTLERPLPLATCHSPLRRFVAADAKSTGSHSPPAVGILAPMESKDRHHLLEIARRRARPGTGSAFGGVRETGPAYGAEIVLPDLGDIRFAVVGGLATALYMPQRMTLDTDLLIAADDLMQAESRLIAAGCQRIGSLTIGDSAWRLPAGRSVDLIALHEPWVHDALTSVVRDGTGRPYIDLPFLVLMKLESGRLQDLADISRMAGCADPTEIQRVRDTIRRYRPQDTEDLESMIHLGRLEHQ
jgi:hypothetical protein